MASICEVTGKRRLKGNRVSHANNKKIHFQQPNIQEKRFFLPELGIRYKVKVTTKGIRTIDKYGGLARFLLRYKHPDRLSQRLQKLRRMILKRTVH